VPNVNPAELAQRFELAPSTGRLRLKSGTEMGEVDRFQVGFNNGGANVLDAAYTDATAVAVDLTDFIEIRFSIRVIAAGSTQQARMQYSTDGSSYTTFANTLALTSTGLKRTEWETIPTAALTVIWIRVGLGDGNGSEEITTTGTVIEVRR
jgi:hypothetical protein